METEGTKHNIEPRHLLVIEDDANDAIQIRRVFSSLEPKCTLFVCRNTSEARAYLKGAGMYENREIYPIPNTVISDIRLPEENGIELIRWLRSEEQFADLPVVVLTGGATEPELETTKALGVELILRKPGKSSNFKMLLETVAEILCKQASLEPISEMLSPYVLR